MLTSIVLAAFLPFIALAAKQPYDVRKIIQAFREPHDDLTILCAHRGLKWNGTAENSRDAYFRASEAGLECIETDIHISADGALPLIHDSGLGRTTTSASKPAKRLTILSPAKAMIRKLSILTSRVPMASSISVCETTKAGSATSTSRVCLR